jgi:hypothetical protein
MLRGGHANIWEDILAMVATRNVWRHYTKIVHMLGASAQRVQDTGTNPHRSSAPVSEGDDIPPRARQPQLVTVLESTPKRTGGGA